jgi:hypothetical protein
MNADQNQKSYIAKASKKKTFLTKKNKSIDRCHFFGAVRIPFTFIALGLCY